MKNRGFSLIEIVVAVAIMGVLSGNCRLTVKGLYCKIKGY